MTNSKTSNRTMGKGAATSMAAIAATLLLATEAMAAGPPSGPLKKCPPDAVVSGAVCMDKYEASVWRIPATNLAGKSNAGLIKKVQKGKATAADMAAGNATQLGTAGDDYAPCTDNGQTSCGDIYAVSLPGVTPAAFITWFQAQQACKNARKRLPSNAEWQAAVAGSPDPGSDSGTTDCNSVTGSVSLTGARSSCVSSDGAFDMVGNLLEWVAHWVPLSTACPGWGSFSNDYMCLSGASTTDGPGALLRGGLYLNGALAGPLTVLGFQPSNSSSGIGFRCAR